MPADQTLLQHAPMSWLLELANPEIRWYALRWLLGRSEEDREVQEARSLIPASPVVKAILDQQSHDGWWVDPTAGYSPLYKTTVWQVLFLAKMGLDASHEQMRRGAEHVFRLMQAEDGSFPSSGRIYKGNLLCLEGLVCRALYAAGYGRDPRLRRAYSFLVSLIRKQEFRCRYNGDLPCAWGAVKALGALTQIPSSQRSPEEARAVESCAGFLLSHNLSAGDYPCRRTVSSHWFRFGFPRGFNSDILEASLAILEAGYATHPQLVRAAEFVASKRDAQWRWRMEESLNGRMLVDIEVKGRPSKWITLRALRLLTNVAVGVLASPHGG